MKHILLLVFISLSILFYARTPVVVDSTTGECLPNASIFDRKGVMIATCSENGEIPYIYQESFPITVRCLGYKEKSLVNLYDSIVALDETTYELPELQVDSRDKRVLHLLAYIREYSTLASYTDTVFLFREKWVDFIVPDAKIKKIIGWKLPRVLSTKSYYHFSNDKGLDSVSDRFNQHFSWSDWIGAVNRVPVSEALRDKTTGNDTIKGKYGVSEIWNRKGERIDVDVNVLADTCNRQWLPTMSQFFRNNTDFERLKIRYMFTEVLSDTLYARDLNAVSINIESKGRGRELFRFNRRGEPFYATTYAEIYFVDREYISEKDAEKWEKLNVDLSAFNAILPPDGVPPLQPNILALVNRVENLDHTQLRLNLEPDRKLVGIEIKPLTRKQRVLNQLKSLIGL